MKLLEKDIVDYIYKNLPELTNGMLLPFRKEYTLTCLNPEYRCDLMAYRPNTSPKAPVACEVKFNGNDRDLIYEVEKALLVSETRAPLEVVVFVDNVSDTANMRYLLSKPDVTVFQYTVSSHNPLKIMTWPVNSEEHFMHSVFSIPTISI